MPGRHVQTVARVCPLKTIYQALRGLRRINWQNCRTFMEIFLVVFLSWKACKKIGYLVGD